MPTLARTLAKKLLTALGSRSTQCTALACYWRTVNTLTLSVKLASVVGKSAQLRTKVNKCFFVRTLLINKAKGKNIFSKYSIQKQRVMKKLQKIIDQ